MTDEGIKRERERKTRVLGRERRDIGDMECRVDKH